MELEPEPGRFRDRRRKPRRQAGWLESDEQRLGPPRERGEASQAIRDLREARPGVRARRQIDDEDVHGPGREEHPGNRQPLVQVVRRQHDEPVQADATRRRLDGVEGTSEVQPRHDRPIGLRLRHEAEGEGRRSRRRRALQRDARAAGKTTGSDDRIECRETGPDDPLDASSRLACGSRSELGWVVGRLDRQRRRGERPDHPGSCGTPPRLERRQSRRHVRGEARHRTASIEHLFDLVNRNSTSISRFHATVPASDQTVQRHGAVTRTRYRRRSCSRR
jgi:hypothetical protein